MRARAGIRRGFSRLSDRVGGGAAPIILLDTLYVETPGSGTYSIPAGARMVEIILLGAGGGPRQGSGGGGGCVEYRYTPPSDGIFLTYTIGSAGSYVADSQPSSLSIPNLPAMVAVAGTNVGGGGSGPPGCIVRYGGNPGQDGQGPFGGRSGGSGQGGGGGGPLGGNGSRPELRISQPGGGTDANSISAGPGALMIKTYGVAP